MIAPLRETSSPTKEPPQTEGVRRARKWIVRTLLTVHSAEPRPRGEARRAWLAAAWVTLVAASYAAYLLVDLFN
jgi:hypothetical protein